MRILRWIAICSFLLNGPEVLTVCGDRDVREAPGEDYDAAVPEVIPTDQDVLWPVGDVVTTKGPSITVNVSSILVSPYLMEVSPLPNTSDTDPARYEGYIKDLLEYLMPELDMNYRIILNTDYGEEVDGEWTGIIGDVVNNRSLIAAAPLHISAKRKTVVDFTYGFLNFELAIVLQKSSDSCNQKPRIQSMDDLVNQDEISYGVTKPSAMYHRILTSNDPVMQKALQYMNEHDSLVPTDNEGFQKVMAEDDFAFLVDNITADWRLRKKTACHLEAVSTGHFVRHNSLAVAKGSPLREKINRIHNKLKTNQGAMYNKWWNHDHCDKKGTAECNGSDNTSAARRLQSNLALVLIFALMCVNQVGL